MTVFLRTGWMVFYDGPKPGDEGPVGGGSYNKRNLGHEAYNFRVTDGRLYGYAETPRNADGKRELNLARIRPEGEGVEELQNVLAILVAPQPQAAPGKGLRIIGWYRHANVFRYIQHNSPGKPPDFGHMFSSDINDCVLLPTPERVHIIPTKVEGGFGQANVRYADVRQPWMDIADQFVEKYDGPNQLN